MNSNLCTQDNQDLPQLQLEKQWNGIRIRSQSKLAKEELISTPVTPFPARVNDDEARSQKSYFKVEGLADQGVDEDEVCQTKRQSP